MEKSLPASIEAERATLGAVLIEREAIVALAGWLKPDHFYLEKHRWVYEAMLTLYSQRTPPDLQTVANELRRRERLIAVGDIPFLVELSNNVPTAYHVEYYGRIVHNTAVLRRGIKAGGRIAAICFSEPDDLATVLADIQREVNDLQPDGATGDELVPLSAVVDEFMAAWESKVEAGILTGISDYDRMTGGLQRGTLVLVAGRPGTGKTSLALNWAEYIAQRGQPVAFFSLEMHRRELLQRLLARRTGLDSRKIAARDVTKPELERLVDEWERLSRLPLHIDHTGALPIAELRRRALRFAATCNKPPLVVVDYLQLIAGPKEKNGTREQEVGAVSRYLKALAKELDTSVIALSQLSRAVEGRASHVPLLSDLRESGQQEQDADVITFIHRPELYDAHTDKKGIAELHIAKHRGGPHGVINTFFDGRTTSFRNLDTFRTPEGY